MKVWVRNIFMLCFPNSSNTFPMAFFNGTLYRNKASHTQIIASATFFELVRGNRHNANIPNTTTICHTVVLSKYFGEILAINIPNTKASKDPDTTDTLGTSMLTIPIVNAILTTKNVFLYKVLLSKGNNRYNRIMQL